MATAMKLAVQAGRLAYLSGRMPKRLYASASSPIEGAIKKYGRSPHVSKGVNAYEYSSFIFWFNRRRHRQTPN